MTESPPTWQTDDLTDRQARILAFLADATQRLGWAPSRREIGQACSIRSTSIVNCELHRLASLGCIVMGRGARTIRVIRG